MAFLSITDTTLNPDITHSPRTVFKSLRIFKLKQEGMNSLTDYYLAILSLLLLYSDFHNDAPPPAEAQRYVSIVFRAPFVRPRRR